VTMRRLVSAIERMIPGSLESAPVFSSFGQGRTRIRPIQRSSSARNVVTH
jgi:hypothetical protein